MAITINILAKPILTLSLVEGGNLLPNTTYYFVAIHTISCLPDRLNAAFYFPSQSPNSEQVSITTTETHKCIKMDWSASGKTGSALIVKWDTTTLLNPDGSYKTNSSHLKWNVAFTGVGWAGLSKTILSADLLTNSVAMYSLNNYNLCALNSLDSKINYKDFGIPYITIDSNENTTSLIAAIKASSITSCFIINEPNSIFAYCNITIASGFNLTLANYDMSFISSYIQVSANNQLTLNNCIYKITANQGYALIFGSYSQTSIYLIGLYRHESILITPTIFNNSFWYYGYYGSSYGDVSTTNFVAGAVLGFSFLNSSSGSNYNKFYNSYVVFYQSSNVLCIGNEFYNNNVRPYDVAVNSNSNVRLKFVDTKTDRANNYVIAQYQTASAGIFDFYYTTLFNITDKNGNEISGCTVTLTNRDGQVFENPVQILAFYNKYKAGVPVIASEIIDLNPFILHITKAGYQSYESVLTIRDKLTTTIILNTLPPPIPFSLRRLISRMFASGKPIVNSVEVVGNQIGITDDEGGLELTQERRLTYLPETNAIKVEVETEEGWEELHTIEADDVLTEQYRSVVPDLPPVYIDGKIQGTVNEILKGQLKTPQILKAKIISYE